jgi:aminoglycoside phosphotransferase (APT) family kinase protein
VIDSPEEVPLRGGRVTAGVSRVGETVRRPSKLSSPFVRALLVELEQSGFDAAPRHLGKDDHGREIFSFQAGDVPRELDSDISDEALAAAARLIRRYHDATESIGLAGDAEVVCHNDLSPCNCVFRDGLPVGLIDFDNAAPGSRLEDLGYALFLWLNLGTDGAPLEEQARRIDLFCRAYGVNADEAVVEAIVDAVTLNVQRLHHERRRDDVEWWQAQLDWLLERRDALTRLLGQRGT